MWPHAIEMPRKRPSASINVRCGYIYAVACKSAQGPLKCDLRPFALWKRVEIGLENRFCRFAMSPMRGGKHNDSPSHLRAGLASGAAAKDTSRGLAQPRSGKRSPRLDSHLCLQAPSGRQRGRHSAATMGLDFPYRSPVGGACA